MGENLRANLQFVLSGAHGPSVSCATFYILLRRWVGGSEYSFCPNFDIRRCLFNRPLPSLPSTHSCPHPRSVHPTTPAWAVMQSRLFVDLLNWWLSLFSCNNSVRFVEGWGWDHMENEAKLYAEDLSIAIEYYTDKLSATVYDWTKAFRAVGGGG